MIFQKFYITITCLWLSLQLILGSVGLPIIEHYCEMSGKTNTSILVEIKECCCKISAQNLAKISSSTNKKNYLTFSETSKDDCCDTEISYQKVDFKAISLEKTAFDFNPFVALLPSQTYFKIYSEKTFFSSFRILHFADLPPPNWKLGKLFIVFIQVFRL
ncbi:hypothetical protein Fleli_3622 [Bernardetia litoralis DSM 6794]|uniref:Uncharacterized protein n=1 Tax=Bernardetia litoralis (strain ATCC 23117 / DSM 6794 / NBRC 15988 / NCIMB 1366 / Fx l1 / Sio-4) TaxID=880071 RepID=I4APQ4_BERLS|nr:hypothetical protein [Bernardetia litoralis]AFM05939.1 hypothetical protein Fleli_3622 [Bernardetia litoralis DSM 6794]